MPKHAALPLIQSDHPAVRAAMARKDLFDGALVCVHPCSMKPKGKGYMRHYKAGQVMQPTDPCHEQAKFSPMFQVYSEPKAPPPAPKAEPAKMGTLPDDGLVELTDVTPLVPLDVAAGNPDVVGEVTKPGRTKKKE